MDKFTATLLNTVCHVIIDGKANQTFYLAIHFVMVLQTIACIVNPESILFAIVKWADPSNYLTPAFSIILCFIIIIALTVLIICKLIITEPDDILVSPNTLKIYLGNVILHLLMICKTSVLAPLVQATLCQIKKSSISGVAVVGIVSLCIYFLLILPLSLYSTMNTFILTPQHNRKLTYINAYFLLNLFRIPFAIFDCVSEGALIATIVLFLIVFLTISIKQPVFAYSHQRLLKGMVSAIGFACFIRLSEIGEINQSILLQLVGMVAFIALIDWISQVRIKKILQLPSPTIQQIKVLIFLVYNIQHHFQKLQYFIVRHHRSCNNPQCSCTAVIQSLSEKNKPQDQYEDTIWYRFLIDFIEQHYNIRQIQALPESEMRQRIGKYQYIVIDLAQIYMFKLGMVNQAYYIVNNYRHLLQERQMSFLSFKQKQKIINYYLQENIYNKYHSEGVVNVNAHSFMNFQIALEMYKKTLVKTAKSTSELWEEMGKREPDAEKIVRLVHLLEKKNCKVRKTYKEIVENFDNSAEILKEITNDYFHKVLNIPEKSPFHVIEIAKYGGSNIKKGEQKVQKISQNMQAFSFDSETPMCFVAVDEDKFGQMVFCNSHFNHVMNLQFGTFTKIDEFMVPEMRKGHQLKMRQFIRGDNFNAEHTKGFTLNRKGKIVYTKILVQIIPSIVQGLRYAFFLKKLMPRKKIIGVKNHQTIAYASQSFDEAYLGQQRKTIVKKIMEEGDRIAGMAEKEQVKVLVQDREVCLRFLHKFTDNDAEWLFIELQEESDVMAETNLRTQAKFNQTRKGYGVVTRDSVMSKDDSEGKSNFEKSDLQQKLAMEKQRKMQQSITSVYKLIVDGKTNISRKMIVFTICIVVVLVGLLIATALVKVGNKSLYQSTKDSNSAFNQFIMTASGAIYSMKMLNFYQYSGNSKLASIFYGIATSYSYSNITNAMSNMVLNYDITTLTQSWATLECNPTNAVFTIDKQNNFLTVSDYLQSPATNLAGSTIGSFKFPPNLKGQTIPLGSTQCLYFQLVLNGLYITIPGFINLKRTTMNNILYGQINTVIPINVFFVVMLLVIAAYVVGKVVLNMRVTKVKNEAYDLFESVDRGLIEEKCKQCKQFMQKYTYLNEKQEERQAFLEEEGDRNQLNTSNANSKNLSKTIEEHTQRQLDINTHIVIKTSNKNKKDIPAAKKVKSKNIFTKGSMSWIFWKFALLASPFLLFVLISGSLEAIFMRQTMDVLYAQERLMTMQQNVNLVLLYGMQHGTEDNQYIQQLNLQAYLSGLMSEVFQIQRTVVSSELGLTQLPKVKQLFDQTSYDNLCTLSNFNFTQMLQANCTTISQGILTKGLYSALVSYMSEMKTLLNTFPDTSGFTDAQRMAYLGNSFFTTNGFLCQYFNDIFNQFQKLFNNDFSLFIQRNANILIFSIVGLIAIMAVGGTLVLRKYMADVRRQLLEIRSLFMLISFQTILKHQSLRVRFNEKCEQFKKIK